MITKLKNLLSNALAVCAGIFLLSAISLMSALIAQYVYGLEPCNLCLYQRVPYMLAGLLGVIGMALLFKYEMQKIAAAIVFTCALIFLAGTAIAFYHVGVEQHWWVSALEGCSADLNTNNAEDLMALLEAKPAVRCDEVAWADPIFGVSMAGYNTLLSAFMAGGCLISSVLIMRKINGVL